MVVNIYYNRATNTNTKENIYCIWGFCDKIILLSVHIYECNFCRIAHDTLFHMRGSIPYFVRDATTASGLSGDLWDSG